ncbi:MAG: hypothetical protein HFI74_04630 [Lachnospiraceae bacterium]|jgi:hypothetical protein|nr:hypothetical protein [Lachnospiraceae bacterium]
MLNEERIRLMTKMASYEEGIGKEYLPMKQYYRRDYVSLEMLKTFFTSTIAFGILCLCWILYEMENITEVLNNGDLISFGISILVKYLIFIVIYQVIAFLVYNRRYTKATRSVKTYYSILKRVQRLREKEEKV